MAFSKAAATTSSIDLIIDFIHDILSSPYRCLVNIVANFIADVLEHPRVKRAAAEVMVEGMNATTEQPDLPQKAAKIYLRLQEENEHVSRQLGEQFPKIAANFIAGAASSLKRSASFSNLRKSSSFSSSKNINVNVEEDEKEGQSEQDTATADIEQEADIKGEEVSRQFVDHLAGFVDKFTQKDHWETNNVGEESSSSLFSVEEGDSAEEGLCQGEKDFSSRLLQHKSKSFSGFRMLGIKE